MSLPLPSPVAILLPLLPPRVALLEEVPSSVLGPATSLSGACLASPSPPPPHPTATPRCRRGDSLATLRQPQQPTAGRPLLPLLAPSLQLLPVPTMVLVEVVGRALWARGREGGPRKAPARLSARSHPDSRRTANRHGMPVTERRVPQLQHGRRPILLLTPPTRFLKFPGIRKRGFSKGDLLVREIGESAHNGTREMMSTTPRRRGID